MHKTRPYLEILFSYMLTFSALTYFFFNSSVQICSVFSIAIRIRYSIPTTQGSQYKLSMKILFESKWIFVSFFRYYSGLISCIPLFNVVIVYTLCKYNQSIAVNLYTLSRFMFNMLNQIHFFFTMNVSTCLTQQYEKVNRCFLKKPYHRAPLNKLRVTLKLPILTPLATCNVLPCYSRCHIVHNM